MFKIILAVFLIILAIAIYRFDIKANENQFDYADYLSYEEKLERLKGRYSKYHCDYRYDNFGMWLDRFIRM